MATFKADDRAAEKKNTREISELARTREGSLL